jgi:hypothetical protein
VTRVTVADPCQRHRDRNHQRHRDLNDVVTVAESHWAIGGHSCYGCPCQSLTRSGGTAAGLSHGASLATVTAPAGSRPAT